MVNFFKGGISDSDFLPIYQAFANRLSMKIISVLFQLILNYNFWFAEFFSWDFLCRCVGFSFIDRRKSVELGSNALTAIFGSHAHTVEGESCSENHLIFIFTIDSILTLNNCLQMSL